MRGYTCVSAGGPTHNEYSMPREGQGRPAGALDREGGTADAHWSFSSSLPRLVMDKAAMNSLKSIVPLLFLSARRVAGRVSECHRRIKGAPRRPQRPAEAPGDVAQHSQRERDAPKTLKTCSANDFGLPNGKNCL